MSTVPETPKTWFNKWFFGGGALALVVTVFGAFQWYVAQMRQVPRLEIGRANEFRQPVAPPPRAGRGLRIPNDRPVPFGIPWGESAPTDVAVENPSDNNVLIQQVIISDVTWIKTPTRPKYYGAGPPIPITFTPSNITPEKNRLIIVLKNPITAPPRDWVTLQFRFVDPTRVGTTLKGKLTIVYNNGETVWLDHLELDTLGRDDSKD
jgi:hypothetical protein